MRARKLRVGVMGAGLIGSPDGRERWGVRAHLPALKALPDLYEVAALCASRRETAEASAQRFQVPHVFTDYHQMVEMAELDLVTVAVRPVYHHPVTMAALEAGKHVFCEWPLALNSTQAEEMYRLAEERGLRHAVGNQGHFCPAVIRARELVQEGFLGSILAFNHSLFAPNFITPRPSHREWLFRAEEGGSALNRSTGHVLEALLSVVNEPVQQVCGEMGVLVPQRRFLDTGETVQGTTVDNVAFVARLGGGAMGTVHVSQTAWFGSGERLELYGTDGMLMVTSEGSSFHLGNARLYGGRKDIERVFRELPPPERLTRGFQELPLPGRLTYIRNLPPEGPAFCVAQLLKTFAAAILEGREFAPSFKEGVQLHRTLEAVERSRETRGWVSLET